MRLQVDKWIMGLTGLLMSGGILAQDVDSSSYDVYTSTEKKGYESQTLFKDGTPVGGYLGFTTKGIELNNQSALMFGAEVGVVLGHQFNIGVAGYGLLSDVKSDVMDTMGNRFYYEFAYGGITFEPVIASNKLVHLTVPVLLGGGGASISPNRPWDHSYPETWEEEFYDSDFFLIVEPGLNVEFNLFKIMRLDIGGSYRLINDLTLVNASNSTFGGWSGNVTLKLGWF